MSRLAVAKALLKKNHVTIEYSIDGDKIGSWLLAELNVHIDILHLNFLIEYQPGWWL